MRRGSWTPTEQARLATLRPPLAELAQEFLRLVDGACEGQPYHVVIGECYRSPEEQAQRLAKGVSLAGPGQSPHQYGLAVDAPLLVDRGQLVTGRDHRGKQVTRRPGEWLPDDHPAWGDLARLAVSVGLESGHFWARLRDSAHVQLRGWRDHTRGGA